MTKPFVWSHSSLNEYDTCPYRFYRKRVLKDVLDLPGAAALEGTAVHKQVENYMNAGGGIPLNLPTYKAHADRLLALRRKGWAVSNEQRMVFTANLKPTRYENFDAWGQAIADVLAWEGKTGLIVDWKNGKYRPGTGADQAARNAIAAFACYPWLDKITTCFIYPNAGKSTVMDWYRPKLDEYLRPTALLVARVNASFETGGWPTTPNGLCREWCPVVGCPHNGKYVPAMTGRRSGST